MVQLLREIRNDMAANGAFPEQLARVDNAIAAAESADQARANTSRSAQAEFNSLLEERAASVETYSDRYRAARETEMQLLMYGLRCLTKETQS